MIYLLGNDSWLFNLLVHPCILEEAPNFSLFLVQSSGIPEVPALASKIMHEKNKESPLLFTIDQSQFWPHFLWESSQKNLSCVDKVTGEK